MHQIAGVYEVKVDHTPQSSDFYLVIAARMMEREVCKEIIVRGHHVYKEVWRPATGQELPVLVELSNRHDRRAVALNIACLRRVLS